jgi:hypothetical protein
MIAFNPDGQWLFRLFPNLPAKLHIPILGCQLGLLTNVAMRDIGIAINREADESLNKATPPKAQGQAGIVALR